MELSWHCLNVCSLDGIGDKIAKRNVSRGQKSRAEEARGSTICAAVQIVRTAEILPRHPFLKYLDSSGILMSWQAAMCIVYISSESFNRARNILTCFSRCVSSFAFIVVVMRSRAFARHQISAIPFCNFHRKRSSRIPCRVYM